MRFLRSLARIFSLVVVSIVVLLLVAQDKLIYHPRPYREAEISSYKQVQPLAYSTSQGRQQCYYVPARSGAAHPQSPLWVVFSGNGSRALDWMELVKAYPSDQDAFLLIDYPGYGACAGHPSSQNIQESANAALGALAAQFKVPVEELQPRLKVLGHSLGAANALAFASAHPVSRVVLIAPFSSLRDMARRTVGWPLCNLLRDNFDNRARMQEITQRTTVPAVEILSGTEDEVIPFTMGRELAGISPKVHFEAVEAAGHNDILMLAESRIFAAMTTTSNGSDSTR